MTLSVAVPPGPVQLMEKVVFEVSADETSLPDTNPPVENPGPAVAVQLVTFDDVQDKVVVFPEDMGLGLAVRLTDGVPAGHPEGSLTARPAVALIPLYVELIVTLPFLTPLNTPVEMYWATALSLEDHVAWEVTSCWGCGPEPSGS